MPALAVLNCVLLKNWLRIFGLEVEANKER